MAILPRRLNRSAKDALDQLSNVLCDVRDLPRGVDTMPAEQLIGRGRLLLPCDSHVGVRRIAPSGPDPFQPLGQRRFKPKSEPARTRRRGQAADRGAVLGFGKDGIDDYRAPGIERLPGEG